MIRVSVLYILASIFLSILSCSRELDIFGVANPVIPQATIISPADQAVLGTNFVVVFSVYYTVSTNVSVYLKIGTNAVIVASGVGTNSIMISNHPPGYFHASLYAKNNYGQCSTTNIIQYTISSPGFTEIHQRSIPGIAGSYLFSDIDLDGDPDLIMVGRTNSIINSSDVFSGIFKNDGSGKFTQTIQNGILACNPYYLLGNNQSSFAGDFDGDGYPDYIQTGRSGNANLTKFYRNNSGNGFLEVNQDVLTNVSAGLVIGGDIDGDNDLDLIVSGWVKTIDFSTSYEATVLYRNDGYGGFTKISSASFPSMESPSAAFGDIDGDGDLDLVLTGWNINVSGPVSKMYRNNGSGSFTEINSGVIAALYNPSVAFADLDGDNDLDLVISGSESLLELNLHCFIYVNDGTGIFSLSPAGSLTGISSILGDVNGDGKVDIILMDKRISGSDIIGKIYFNQGGMNFTEMLLTNITNQMGNLIAGDIDGDGDLDLISNSINGSGYNTCIFRNDWNRGGCLPYGVINRSVY